MARQCCVTVVIVIIIALAYVAEAVPGDVALIVVLPIVGRMCAAAADAAATADAAAVYDIEHSTMRIGAIR